MQPQAGSSAARSSLTKSAPSCSAWRTIPFFPRSRTGRFVWIRRLLILPNRAAPSPLCICATDFTGKVVKEQEKDCQGKDLQEKELRGCVGYVLPSCPLYRAVAETARAAAFDDNRFPPVTIEEALALEIELSILSPARPIQADEIEVGRHGLLISGHGRRGLLLPQVPVEHEWDRLTFLEQTCRKAGLPLDAWKQGATIEAFTAEVFGERNSGQ